MLKRVKGEDSEIYLWSEDQCSIKASGGEYRVTEFKDSLMAGD